MRAQAPAEVVEGQGAARTPATNAAARAMQPLLLALALALLLAASFADLGRLAPAAERVAAPPLPALEGGCDASPEAAAERARRAESSGRARIARYPFAAAEGLPALQALLEAEACFVLAHDDQGRARSALRARLWRSRLERDYRDHVLRYERALDTGRPALARADVCFLLALLSGHEGAFVAALKRLQLELDETTQLEDPS